MGVIEQYDRAELFYREAIESSEPRDSFRRLMAAVYFGRAALEIMRGSAKAGALKIELREFDQRLAELLPHYNLVKAIRIRDFHRYGLLGPQHILLEQKIVVPPHGTTEVGLSTNPADPQLEIELSDASRNFEFFMASGDLVQSEDYERPVPLKRIMAEYLAQLPNAIDLYRSALRSKSDQLGRQG
jgi:hypothetical protein